MTDLGELIHLWPINSHRLCVWAGCVT